MLITNKRLKILRTTLDLTQQEFAERLGIKRNTIANYETGRNKPIDSVFSLICREFNVNEKWLKNGIEPMFLKTPSSTMEQLKQEFDLDEFSYNIVYEYLKLDKEKRAFVRDFFYNVLNNIDSQELSATIQTHDQFTSHSESAEKFKTVEEAEEAYIKNHSQNVKKTGLPASNTTAADTTENQNKIVNQ